MTHVRPYLMAVFAAAGIFVAAPALAQSSVCLEGQKILTERQNLIQQVNKLSNGGKKQMEPRAACNVLTKLVKNGDAGLKWMTTNKDWCQVPDDLVKNFTEDHSRTSKFKGEACKVAAKVAEMEKRAKEGQGRGPLGGGGLTGSYRIPQGAL